jgi:hypothetical protein
MPRTAADGGKTLHHQRLRGCTVGDVGERAVLVSHWSVNSDATVKLITGAMSSLAANNRIGRAEAMRQSMLALIETRKSYESHPFFWAPFVVVGEGGGAACNLPPILT